MLTVILRAQSDCDWLLDNACRVLEAEEGILHMEWNNLPNKLILIIQCFEQNKCLITEIELPVYQLGTVRID